MGKKISFIILMALIAMTANAYTYINDVVIGNYKYDLKLGSNSNEENVATAKGLSTAGTSVTIINIPSYVVYNGNRYRVSQIASNAFLNNTAVTKVILNYGLDEINSSAFAGCSNVTLVRLPSSVTTVNANVFDGCSKLSCVAFASEKVPSFTSTTAFSGMPADVKLSLVSGKAMAAFNANSTWKNAFSQIGKNLDYYAYDFSLAGGVNYTIQDGIPYNSNKARCTIVSIEPTVTTLTLNQRLSSGATNNAPGTYKLTCIADSACFNNTTLTKIVDNGTKASRIGSRAFYGCTSLTSADVTADTIMTYAFYNCSNLENINLYNSNLQQGVRYMGGYVFGQTALTTATIPACTANIGYAPFFNCAELTQITVNGSNTAYSSYKGALYNKARTWLYQIPGKWTYGNYNLADGPFPETVERVLQYAGAYCTTLTNLQFNYGVKSIDNYAFDHCASLTKVRLPSSLSPASGVTVSSTAFANCPAIRNVYMNFANPPAFDYFPAVGNKSDIALYTPHDSQGRFAESSIYSQYNLKTGTYDHCHCWDFMADGLYFTVTSSASYNHNGNAGNGQLSVVMIDIGSYVINSAINYGDTRYVPTEIGYRAACNNLADIDISQASSIVTIKPHAFDGMPLINFTFYNVEDIQEYAFYNCTNLNEALGTDYALPYLQNVGPYAFDGSGITAFKASASLTSIGSNAFARTSNLDYIDMSACKALTTINDRAFYQGPENVNGNSVAAAHRVVKLSNSITTIGEETFYNNTLDEFNFPASLKTIKMGALNCSNLAGELELPYGITTIEEDALSTYNVTKIVLPSSVTSVHSRFFTEHNQTTHYKALVVNKTSPLVFANDGEGMTATQIGYNPTTIYIPVNCVNTWKADDRWKDSKYNILQGAYDFTGISGDKFTVLSLEPSGISTCKIVYNPETHNSHTDLVINSACDSWDRQFITTEIGDKCFQNDTELSTIYLANTVQKIGDYAFYNSALSKIMNEEVLSGATSVSDGFIRSSVNSIGTNAFHNCNNLHELFLPHIDNKNALTCGKYFFGGNADDFKCWVDYRRLGDFINTSDWNTSRIYPHLRLDSEWQSFACVKSIKFENVDVEAFTVSDYDQDTKKAMLSNIVKLAANNGGVVHGDADGTYHRLNYTSSSGTTSDWLVGVTDVPQTVNSTSELSYFRLNDSSPKFDKVASATFNRGYAYLKLNTAITGGKIIIMTNLSDALTGDVNDDGAVNAADITALYNYILNGDTTFLSTSDVNNDGAVNAGDVTAVYNTILGN